MTNDQLNQFTFSEALRELKEGKKVRLPEWTGYWFQEDDKIKVFTRTGEILETPHYHKFEDRNDWQVTDGSLGFDFAILALKAGKLVTRTGWTGKGMFVCKQIPANIGIDIIPKMQSLPDSAKAELLKRQQSIRYTNQMLIVNTNGQADSWVPSASDVLAEDWVVYNG